MKMKRPLMLTACALAAAAALHTAYTVAQTAVVSQQLKQTIAGQTGIGEINLLQTKSGSLTAADLEAYRNDNGGNLSFAVDVNENNEGLESARAQGVAVEEAWIEATFPGNVVKRFGKNNQATYTSFWTETQALIAKKGSTTRQNYYTLLGDAGSNEITGRKIGTTVFDSTLKIAVNESLAGATSVTLHVKLLETNSKLGDPENFYDFSGGFEDLAIITKSSAKVFDVDVASSSSTSFRSESPGMELSPEGQNTVSQNSGAITVASTLSWISATGPSYKIVAYEDLYPQTGDYDFNDAVVAYRYQLGINGSGLVERIDGVAYLIARGSSYSHDWRLQIPLPAGATLASASCSTLDGSGSEIQQVPSGSTSSPACALELTGNTLNWRAFTDTLYMLPANADGVRQRNTWLDRSPIKGPKASFSLTLATPIATSQIGPDSPLLDVKGTGASVGLSSRDPRGFPAAMVMPSDWKIPAEGVDLGLAYPGFASFVTTGGSKSASWYLSPVASKVVAWNVLDWAW